MSNNKIQEITLLIEFLPIKDRPIANEYLQKRDFKSLLEITQSDIRRYFRNLKKDIPNEELSNLDLDKLRLLENLIILYTFEIDGVNTVIEGEGDYYE